MGIMSWNKSERLNNKLKILTDKNGDKIVVISDKLFTNTKIRNKYGEVAKAIKNIFAELEESSIIINDNKKEVFFDKFTADEYLRSRDTTFSKPRNKTAKINAVKEIKKIVENAKYLSHMELFKSKKDAKEKRKIDASKGFDYYKVKFAFEKESGAYQVFDGILNVRIDRNDKNFVYDITKISELQLASGNPLSMSTENSDIL